MFVLLKHKFIACVLVRQAGGKRSIEKFEPCGKYFSYERGSRAPDLLVYPILIQPSSLLSHHTHLGRFIKLQL